MAARVIVETALGATCTDIRPPPSWLRPSTVTFSSASMVAFEEFAFVELDVVEALARSEVLSFDAS